jgi:dCTP deaminase
MMSDTEIHAAITEGEIVLDPYDDRQLQPASYDARAGNWAFSSSLKEKVNLSQRGALVIEPGEFAIVETRERIALGRWTAGILGLRSEYAKQGLLMLSGPQIDPTFEGILKVRLVNLAPKKIALGYESPFLTIEFLRLGSPVSRPYSGPSLKQDGITSADMQELLNMEGMTMGQVFKTLSALAKDVAELRGAVGRLTWYLPAIIGVGIAIIGILVAVRR